MDIFNHAFRHRNEPLHSSVSPLQPLSLLDGPRVRVRDARAAGGARGFDCDKAKSGGCIMTEKTTLFLLAYIVSLAVNVLRAGGFVSLPTMFLLGILRVVV